MPDGVAVDSRGDLFIADTGNNRVREVNLSTGVITTVAGNGDDGYDGDGLAATAATIGNDYGVAIDADGDLFITQQVNYIGGHRYQPRPRGKPRLGPDYDHVRQ